MRSPADSAATHSRWRILRAANLRLPSSADAAAVLRHWRSRRAANLPGRLDSVSDARSSFDALAVVLICYATWGGLPSCPRMLLLSPAFPPIGHCVTCNGLGRTGIRKPTEVCGCVNLVCGGFKHTYIYIYIYMTTYVYTLTMRIYMLEGAHLRSPNYTEKCGCPLTVIGH